MSSDFAGWGERLLAMLIDAAVGFGAFVVLYAIAVALDAAGAPLAVYAPFSAGAFAAFWLIPVITMARTNGETIGKRVMGIRVVRTSGAATGFWWSLLREVPVKAIVGLVPVDNLWPLWDRENRALHDMVVRSRVVNR